jgi:branched-chain amino acid transport system ATP-binding protein
MGTMLEVRDLTKRFGGFTAVDRIGFDLAEGEILGLIGPNGSGKSTTFNLIAGALAPTAGSIRLEGREIGGLTPTQICHLGIARTYQIPRPFRKLTILENVALAAFFGSDGRISRNEAWQLAKEALDLTQLPSDPRARVDGLGAAGLKKLELARALATQPRLLLADESLGGLDEREMDQAADMLSDIRREKGITIIWVEHIMGVLMRVVDRCVVLDHGEIIATGLPQDVAHDPKVVEVYLGSDAEALQTQVADRLVAASPTDARTGAPAC